MNLAMIGALGKMTEWETHCRDALGNGVTKEQIRAACHIVGLHCAVPQALECFRVSRKVLEEHSALPVPETAQIPANPDDSRQQRLRILLARSHNEGLLLESIALRKLRAESEPKSNAVPAACRDPKRRPQQLKHLTAEGLAPAARIGLQGLGTMERIIADGHLLHALPPTSLR